MGWITGKPDSGPTRPSYREEAEARGARERLERERASTGDTPMGLWPWIAAVALYALFVGAIAAAIRWSLG
jgi:hypothetical protein